MAIASIIRPDVLLITCMEEITGNIRAAEKTLKGRLGDDIRVELMGFDPSMLERDPLLPY